MVEALANYNIITLGLLASLAAGLATGVGALPIFFTRKIPEKVLNVSLGFAAGVMLAATSFSLIIPAIEKGGGGVAGATIALFGILAGGGFLDIVDKFFPDTNLLANSTNEEANLRKVWLFALAITIHNFPEGLAVGVGFGDGDIVSGLSLAIAIGLQNIPEGLAIALPFIHEKIRVWKAFGVALASGLVEPIGGLLGVGLVQVSRPLLPFALSFAAGAMLFVINNEIIPETQKDNDSNLATHAILIGFVIMMFLDNILG
ncbi:putative divalent heavy-metal cations transporter [Halobacteroides halobius DSM 5150]|uniref:Putative divalent heavy-metal cations transporter n=1 Tax=Halobacteroides halobius (strain ATCC 35273 / DSM 5150 / MD-1) TaxID=748449 RepID=L0K566_HALHC|nr:ZIP family metal transporter [Halobacteroides halobius]AGB40402.1 putative divalent heavy-metal cations transporter [Halobacteroides halobius DSM 5150]